MVSLEAASAALATPDYTPTRSLKRKRASDRPDVAPLQDARTPLGTPTGSVSSTSSGKARSQSAAGQAALNRGLYLSFVDSAFSELKQGRTERYDELVAVFAPFSSASQQRERALAGDLDQVRPMLEALSRSISALSSSAHRTLLDTLVGLAWTNLDEPIARAYAGFVCALVAGRPEWLSKVIDRTIEGFKPRTLGNTSFCR